MEKIITYSNIKSNKVNDGVRAIEYYTNIVTAAEITIFVCFR